ncbi:SGNH/GDSL hydrolase family protein [Anaerocolumna jejuensis]|uniref:SGNH/GDSL hydrolase family protein n=1 Tax=Anaerocolumna jejuensis TaxID=259063 RepID=UPI003F7BEDFA
MKEYKPEEIKYLKIHGRTAGSAAPLPLFWTGSGIELNVKGSELWIEVEVDYGLYEPWLGVLINSAKVSRQMLNKGRYWLCLFRGMNENTVKNVRVIREVQAMNGDPDCSLVIHSVRADGEFLPVKERPVKIEFIGDSITSGEGVVGAREEEDWISMWFSAADNYTALTAKELNADYRVISQSGWGVLTSWDNNPDYNIPKYYEKVCGLLTGEKNENLGALKENDFNAWQPDIVVVNLGTNDSSAFNTPEWKDEATGRHHKQRSDSDGTFNEEDLKAFEEAVSNFLAKIRKYNQKAHIVWAYGMLGNSMMPAIFRAADTYQRKSGDRKVSVFQLPNTTDKTIGSRSHPGILSHEKAAEELSVYLRSLL